MRACNGEHLFIPNDLSGDNKLEGCGESTPLSEVSHA